ncbi:unnamed protein product [Lactuca virosa]|uniref:Uncharacterized protein n=1 Tax=Lactuca virosa TaxID=75947 RepID=A0AAU9N3G3_9ASTR|nr:unnamed protein product [Lactuca virosa]
MSSVSDNSNPMTNYDGVIIGVSVTAFVLAVVVKIWIIVFICKKQAEMQRKQFSDDSRFIPLTMVKFLDDMEREKPI